MAALSSSPGPGDASRGPIPAEGAARDLLKDQGWRPTATRETLGRRAALLAQTRAFFAARGVLEVETPVLSAAAATDPSLASLSTRYQGPGAAHGVALYLHTSPEFAMKRLLAAGSGPIFQVCKVFRDGESGLLHNPEFTLLEWYRPGFDHQALMGEVSELLQWLLGTAPAERLSYRDAFVKHAGVDAFTAGAGALLACARAHAIIPPPGLDRDGLCDLLLSHIVGPRLGLARPLLLYDFPASQAALARCRGAVASRFELYLKGVELANGFHELNDVGEQRRRFEHDLAARRRSGLPQVPVDERLLAALAEGLPDCAGVALGFDRLLMVALDLASIDEALGFPLSRA